MSDIKSHLGRFAWRHRRQRANGKGMRAQGADAEAAEPQKAMLSWSPCVISWYCDACKATLFYEDLRFLT